jgi:hypothetical protein
MIERGSSVPAVWANAGQCDAAASSAVAAVKSRDRRLIMDALKIYRTSL